MHSGIRDKAEGTFHEVKGSIREAVGKLSDNPVEEAKGLYEKIAGKVQEQTGKIKQALEK
jgi:uncharacterized protein YjbJ (UPF0337 family)